MFRDLARDTIGLHLSSDSEIVQLVFVLENVSVAAVNRDTSIEFEGADESAGCIEPPFPVVFGDNSFGSWVDIIGACSPTSPLSPGFGDGGGVDTLV